MNKLNKKEIADSKTEIERESNKGSFKGNFSAKNFPDKNVDTPTKQTNKFLVKRSTYSTKETSKTSVKPSSSTKEPRKAPNKRGRSEQGGLKPLLAKANKIYQQSIRQEEEIDKNKGRSLYYQFNFEVCNFSGYGRGLGKKIN